MQAVHTWKTFVVATFAVSKVCAPLLAMVRRAIAAALMTSDHAPAPGCSPLRAAPSPSPPRLRSTT